MALTQDAFGVVTLTGSEVDLFPTQVGLKHYEVHLFTDELVAGDEILVRISVKDVQTSTLKKYRTQKIEGPQTDPTYVFNWLATDQYLITVQQTSGTFKDVTWVRYTS